LPSGIADLKCASAGGTAALGNAPRGVRVSEHPLDVSQSRCGGCAAKAVIAEHGRWNLLIQTTPALRWVVNFEIRSRGKLRLADVDHFDAVVCLCSAFLPLCKQAVRRRANRQSVQPVRL